MTTNRVPKGVPTGGQFAGRERSEADLAPLAPTDYDTAFPGRRTTRTPWDDPDYVVFKERVRPVHEIADRLCARESVGGAMIAAESIDVVREELRAALPRLSEDEFENGLRQVMHAANQVSTVEAADASDTAAYEAQALAAGIEESDHPVDDPDWQVGDATFDCESYKTATIAYWDGQVSTAVEQMVLANEARAASAGQAPVARPA